MTQPIPPFWFVQRQAKAEPAGPDTYRVTAPNLDVAFISIRPAGNGLFAAGLRRSADGPEEVATEAIIPNEADAWSAAFELYRTHIVI